MPLETLIQFANKVSDLPDKPNTQMSAEELKAQFDAAPEELRGKYNALVNTLKSSVTGDSGAENLGSANISGVAGNTVHGQMKDLFEQLKAVVLGQVPNKSITREKFADGAVDFSTVQKEIANLNLQLAASQLVPSGKTYGWDPTTSFGVIVDFTKGKTTAQLNAGDTDLTGKVTMTQGTFVAGKKVTVIGRNPADDSIVKEQATITSVSPLTISPLVNSYKTGAWIKRTTANNTTNGLKFGGVDDSVTHTITDATIINQAYDTSGNGGRKIVRLNDGSLVAVVKNSTTEVIHYKSTNNGTTWTELYKSTVTGLVDVALATNGTRIYSIRTLSGGTVNAIVLNGDGSFVENKGVETVQQSAMGNVSLAINGTELHAVWTSKNTTYPNSFNIRYAKGTINADGTVTWGAVEQRTTFNTSGQDAKEPCIIIRADGNPSIFVSSTHSTYPGIFVNNYNSSWETKNANLGTVVYLVSTYAQSSPSAIFVPQSVNGLTDGRIWVAWHGTDSTDTTYNNIRVSYSDDGGANWSAMNKRTSGNTVHRKNVSCTANSNNEIFLVYEDGADINQQKNTSGSWGTATSKTLGGTFPATLFDLTIDIAEPLLIYKDDAKVGFYGTWTDEIETPITENTLRLTLTQQAKEVMTYLHYTGNLTADASVNGNAMDKTTTSTESQFTKVLGSLQDIEVEITLTRPTTSDDITIDKILGGVA